MFDLEAAILNAARSKKPGALAAFQAVRKRALVVMSTPGPRRGRALTEPQLQELIRAEIRDRKDAIEFLAPTSDDYLLNKEIISVLSNQLGRAERPRRGRR